MIGGQPATIQYYGAAPGKIAGLMQVNVQIPTTALTGSAVEVRLTVGSASSPANATVAVR